MIWTRILFAIYFVLFVASCGGGSNGNPPTTVNTTNTTPNTVSTTGKTVEVMYTKGPVTGAQASLIDTSGNVVAGPVSTTDGAATFENVSFPGEVYARFEGGSYVDEATGNLVELGNSFRIRSGVFNSTGVSTLTVNGTPLTEIGFRRAEAAASPLNLDFSEVNGYLDQVADEYGLDGIDLTTVTPTRLEDMPTSVVGDTFNRDRYGTVLAAITQQIFDAGDPASESSLDTYMTTNAVNTDRTAFTTALTNLQVNPNTSSFINNTIVGDVNLNSGRLSQITFKVDMGDSYNSNVSIGYIIGDGSVTQYQSMEDQNNDGVYAVNLSLSSGTNIKFRFIQGLDAAGTIESVPSDCGVFTASGFMRSAIFTDEAQSLLAVPYSGCIPDICSADVGRSVPVSIQGRQLLDGTQPIHMKGVAWSPIPEGLGPGFADDQFVDAVVEDAELMEDAGINVVRTYVPILDKGVLDELWSHGIYVIMTVYYGGSETIESTVQSVCAVKDHPAVLAWIIGNEWNYFNVIQPNSFDRAVAKVGLIADAIKLNDPTRPVSTVYGYLPPPNILSRLPNIDLWGLNVYSGISFYDLFDQWEAISDGPMYLAEYGVDAYDSGINSVNEAVQADFLENLTLEINANASVNGQGIAAGGIAFEFDDSWWKYSGPGNDWSVHDTEPSFTNPGFPDPDVQEEWWGLVDINGNPRQAYFTYQNIPAPVADSP